MEQKIALIKRFLQLMPSNKIFGLEIVKLNAQELLLKVPFKEEFVGDFAQRRWHGGILASIADSAGGIMGAITFRSHKDRINTIDIRVDYLHRTYDLPIYAKAKIIKTGKRIVIIDVDLYHEENKIHTTARITCSVLRN